MSGTAPSFPGGLYAILDESIVTDGDFSGAAVKLLEGGARVIQLRMKTIEARDMLRVARAISSQCKKYGATFIVNDRADVALISGAAGVHVGQDDLPVDACRKVLGDGAIIGVSTHSTEEVSRAVEAGADYIGYGAIYPTDTKGKQVTARGVEALARIVNAVSIPVVAIGGIEPDNVAAVKAAGARAAATISALASYGDLKEGAIAMVRAWEETS